MRQSPRARRIAADFQALIRLQNESTIFSFRHQGTLPEMYDVHFRGLGLGPMDDGRVVLREHHEVRLELGSAYPRMMPTLSWRTPIFHPNISHNGVVCLGGYSNFWVPSLKLDELCVMLWDMIRYQNFDIYSPYNREAALWVRDQSAVEFPLDQRGLRDRISGAAPREEALNESHAIIPPRIFGAEFSYRRPEPRRPTPIQSAECADIVFIE